MPNDYVRQIFLAHATEDSEEVAKIFSRLNRLGFNPWIYTAKILPGQTWDKETLAALKKSRFVITFLSTVSVNKEGYVQEEFNVALELLNEIPKDQISIIPVRLDECQIPEKFHGLESHCIDLFKDGGFEQLLEKIENQSSRATIILRHTPNKDLSKEMAKSMIAQNGFFDVNENPHGRGITHQYELRFNAKVVCDHATALMWERSGSSEWVSHSRPESYSYADLTTADTYVGTLNANKFAGFSDWRPPTLEEAMSLMEPEPNKENNLYIDPIFDGKQSWIWTADSSKIAVGTTLLQVGWNVLFGRGMCNFAQWDAKHYYVRAVRSAD